MLELSGTATLWIKAFHIISVIAWMAGLLYLPRLFVYHVDATPQSEWSETLKTMERRLLKAIMNPAMLASLGTGGALLMNLDDAAWKDGWLHGKLVLAAGLLAVHIVMGRGCRDFAEDKNTRTGKFYRIMNEVPTVLMIGIVILVVVQPF